MDARYYIQQKLHQQHINDLRKLAQKIHVQQPRLSGQRSRVWTALLLPIVKRL